jgi:hypothetical protein
MSSATLNTAPSIHYEDDSGSYLTAADAQYLRVIDRGMDTYIALDREFFEPKLLEYQAKRRVAAALDPVERIISHQQPWEITQEFEEAVGSKAVDTHLFNVEYCLRAMRDRVENAIARKSEPEDTVALKDPEKLLMADDIINAPEPILLKALNEALEGGSIETAGSVERFTGIAEMRQRDDLTVEQKLVAYLTALKPVQIVREEYKRVLKCLAPRPQLFNQTLPGEIVPAQGTISLESFALQCTQFEERCARATHYVSLHDRYAQEAKAEIPKIKADGNLSQQDLHAIKVLEFINNTVHAKAEQRAVERIAGEIKKIRKQAKELDRAGLAPRNVNDASEFMQQLKTVQKIDCTKTDAEDLTEDLISALGTASESVANLSREYAQGQSPLKPWRPTLPTTPQTSLINNVQSRGWQVDKGQGNFIDHEE